MAYNEAAYNKIIINDTLLGVASDKREGILSIIAGLSNNGYDNTLIINNLNLDEYKNNNSVFIAPSDISLSKNNRLILNTKVINNFEHYYLIVSNKINTTPLLKSYDAPINISSEGVLALYTLKE